MLSYFPYQGLALPEVMLRQPPWLHIHEPVERGVCGMRTVSERMCVIRLLRHA